ncbi:uncharacterized protein PV07_04131 [Cladophialophora immunda]|uniref:Flavoprotein domain-containing protein n=1 Tax=Cladophialophora immunda TaxID=569365 RepID=A0A0D1ZWS6_9EURO|nr:uncharacterized protein PV07_04131 [Cladophialophora immunda]KIW32601.1 hypothetical protein PV07_04131 [Cladophialophora immunda]
MLTATESGAIVFLPVPAFYNCPASIDDTVNQSVRELLDMFGVDTGNVERWTGLSWLGYGQLKPDTTI